MVEGNKAYASNLRNTMLDIEYSVAGTRLEKSGGSLYDSSGIYKYEFLAQLDITVF